MSYCSAAEQVAMVRKHRIYRWHRSTSGDGEYVCPDYRLTFHRKFHEYQRVRCDENRAAR